MTLTEFRENITTWGDLMDFCSEENMYDMMDDIYSAEQYDEAIWDDIHEWDDSWDSLGDYLRSLPATDYDYFYMRGDEWYLIDPGDTDIYDRKNDVEEEAIRLGKFDPEDNDVDLDELDNAVADAAGEELASDEPEWEIQEFDFGVLASMSKPGAQILASAADMMQPIGPTAQPEMTTTTVTVDYVEPEFAFSPAANIDSLLTGWNLVTTTTSATGYLL